MPSFFQTSELSIPAEDIWAKEKQPKRAKSKKQDGHLSERKIIQKSEHLSEKKDFWKAL
jgi:hypothetical protein